MSFQDPSAKLMKTFKVKFFNFIWENKPDKIIIIAYIAPNTYFNRSL